MCVVFFFFFKQKTAYEITVRDWSSDVCSSDLAVRYDPKNVAALFNRGLILRDKGEDDRALRDFTQLLKLDAKNAPALFQRGMLYVAKGESDKAADDLNAVIRLDPKNLQAVYYRGKA